VPLAFGRRRLWAATADSALLCAVMANYASLARRVDRAAAALAVPEIAWTAFATVLSAAVAMKNSGQAVPRPAGQSRLRRPCERLPADLGAQI
jgi:tryptophan-rich sensory protein